MTKDQAVMRVIGLCKGHKPEINFSQSSEESFKVEVARRRATISWREARRFVEEVMELGAQVERDAQKLADAG
jgi:hypothetical protein